MTISLVKFEDMSLQHWIKDVIIPLKWSEKVRNVPLNFSSARSRFEADIVWLPNFLDHGRGWVFFDPTSGDNCVLNSIPTTEQTTRITVYNESGSVISPANYTINYADGAVIAVGGTTTPEGVPTAIDFTQYYVGVIDGWPGEEPPDPPIVAIDMVGFEKLPRQLGGGRIADRRMAIHIFATSSSERDDLTEFIHDAMFNRHIPIIDFREGEPLTYEGVFNNNYTGKVLSTNVNDDALFYFRDLKVEIINGRSDWSDLNKWRSKISFTMRNYRDGLDFLVLE